MMEIVCYSLAEMQLSRATRDILHLTGTFTALSPVQRHAVSTDHIPESLNVHLHRDHQWRTGIMGILRIIATRELLTLRMCSWPTPEPIRVDNAIRSTITEQSPLSSE